MSFAAAISEHPVTAHAVGEVVGQVLEALDARPDLAFLFVTAPHAGALEDAAAVVEATLGAPVLVGCAAEAVAGPRREVEQSAAVSLWAGAGFSAQAVRVDPAGHLRTVEGAPWGPAFAPEALLVVADPYGTDVDGFLRSVQERFPGLPVVGGLTSAARGPGGNRVALGSRVFSQGGAGAFVASCGLSTLVSQGCRPVGRPWAVTRAERNMVYELAGQPALARLMTMATEELGTAEVALVNRGGLHIGVVIDEHQEEFGPGDFLVRNVLGADRSVGAIAVDAELEIGSTVQFQLRDGPAADRELRLLAAGRRAEAALLFTCNGRGTRMFHRPDHDAAVLADLWDNPALAGMSAAGEIGPVGGRNFLHGFTASVALFDSSHRG